MEKQLPLIEEAQRDWRLDEHTKQAGRRGIAEARAALTAAQRDAADKKAA